LVDTTRSPREGETNGTDYHFVTKPQFELLRDDKAFIEHAVFGGNMYGTSFKAVEDVSKAGNVCVLDIEMEVTSPLA
jgi:guanylate kinase